METVRSVRSGPRSPGAFAPLHNVSHVTQTKRRKFHVKIRSMRTSASTCACHNEAHILYTYALAHSRVCVRACVREGWQPRREISYEITGSHCRGSPLGPPQPPRGRSLICNEPAPPVIILRLRDHVITRARIGAVGSSRLVLPETPDFQDGSKDLRTLYGILWLRRTSALARRQRASNSAMQ